MQHEIAGIRIPADLAPLLTSVSEITANSWNPNRMDSFMRGKLVTAIKKDGFVLPVLVRPIASASARPDYADLVARGVKWEVVDGEHRWDTGCKELGMSQIPVLDLGPISDEDAKAITVKANSLRGEFDSVKLAEMIKGLVDTQGMSAVVAELPYTQERLQSMVDLLSVDVSTLTVPDADLAPAEGERPASDEFKTFDGAAMTFDCKCPRCGFEFNSKPKGDDEWSSPGTACA